MGLSIDELLRRIGIDAVRLQFLHETATNVTKRKRGIVITFYTEETTVDAFAVRDPEMIGMVVWVPYQKFREVQAAWKREQEIAGGTTA